MTQIFPVRTFRGYTNLGGPAWPILPVWTILTDRSTGALWSLVHDTTHTYVGISDVAAPADEPVIAVYGPMSGPYLGDGIRLFVRDGRLGFEAVDGPVIVDRPVLTRRAKEPITINIILPVTRDPHNAVLGTLAMEVIA